MIMYRCGGGGGGDINSYFIECQGNYYLPDGGATFRADATFNAPVNIGDNVASADYLFDGCRNFNSPVHFGNNVQSCSHMFELCYNFNLPLNFPEGVTNFCHMFNRCNNFDQPLVIPNSAIDCSNMFQAAPKFNQPLVIPNGVLNCAYMFNGSAFRHSIEIPDSVVNCFHMFDRGGCGGGSSITVGKGVMDCSYMFGNTSMYTYDVFIKGNTYRPINVTNMFYNHNNQGYGYRKNLHFNVALNNLFNGRNTIVGNNMYWTADPANNCFYSANFYCYYDYEG